MAALISQIVSASKPSIDDMRRDCRLSWQPLSFAGYDFSSCGMQMHKESTALLEARNARNSGLRWLRG